MMFAAVVHGAVVTSTVGHDFVGSMLEFMELGLERSSEPLCCQW